MRIRLMRPAAAARATEGASPVETRSETMVPTVAVSVGESTPSTVAVSNPTGVPPVPEPDVEPEFAAPAGAPPRPGPWWTPGPPPPRRSADTGVDDLHGVARREGRWELACLAENTHNRLTGAGGGWRADLAIHHRCAAGDGDCQRVTEDRSLGAGEDEVQAAIGRHVDDTQGACREDVSGAEILRGGEHGLAGAAGL